MSDILQVPVTRKNLLCRIRFKLRSNGQRFIKARAASTFTEIGAKYLVLSGSEVLWFSNNLEEFARMLGVLDDAETLEENES